MAHHHGVQLRGALENLCCGRDHGVDQQLVLQDIESRRIQADQLAHCGIDVGQLGSSPGKSLSQRRQLAAGQNTSPPIATGRHATGACATSLRPGCHLWWRWRRAVVGESPNTLPTAADSAARLSSLDCDEVSMSTKARANRAVCRRSGSSLSPQSMALDSGCRLSTNG